MKRLGIAVIIALLASLVGSPVYADTLDPDETPTLVQTDVYRNLLEPGDSFYLFYLNIPYATANLPDTSVTETFIVRLIALGGVTILGSATGYAFNDDGYGYNVYGMYFPAAEGLAWEALYTMRLSGNPIVFDTPPIYNYSISATDYTSLVTTDDNRTALAARLLTIADDLDSKWVLAVSSSLLSQSESGTTLSIYGESFFRGAIYGVQTLAPAAFAFVIVDVEIVDREWSSNYTDVLKEQWVGTWVEEAKTGSTDFFGTTYDLLSLLLLVAACGAILMGNIGVGRGGEIWAGLVDVLFILAVGARLAVFDLIYSALLAALAVIYLGVKFWGLRST